MEALHQILMDLLGGLTELHRTLTDVALSGGSRTEGQGAQSTGAAEVRSTGTLKLWKIPLSNRVRQRRGREEHRASEVGSCGGKKQASSRGLPYESQNVCNLRTTSAKLCGRRDGPNVLVRDLLKGQKAQLVNHGSSPRYKWHCKQPIRWFKQH
ncbi:hypothetical protein LXL04_000544 [Taraxacum kok-saghyz]